MRKTLALLLIVATATAGAQTTPLESAQQFVQREASVAAASLGGDVRLEVTVGTLASGLQLAPCARIEPFLPSGVRLWGRTHVGVRCMEGATWQVLLPVTVRVFGPALVAARPLPALQPVSADDLVSAEVEWTREPQGVATDPGQVAGRILTRPVGVGQPLPLAALRAPQVIGQGDPVRVLGQGRGFSVQTEAVALAAAQDGQLVRVRTSSGRILSGVARQGRTVEVQF